MKNEIVVIGGCGHVGLPIAIALADKNFQVTSLDVDSKRISIINSGNLPVIEIIEKGAEVASYQVQQMIN
jgi:UDP-N-acetyl-D-mannosaminuronic acid dehydrogenase